MRVLFLTSRLPYPPDRGDRYRTFNFIRQMSAEHDVVLVSFIGSEKERAHVEALEPYCSAVHVVLQTPLQSVRAVALNAWRKTPLQVLYYRSRAMRRTIDELAATASCDAVYIHLFRMAPYGERLRDHYRIVDLTDAVSREIEQSLPYRGLLSRAVYTLERPRIERYERLVTADCDEAWFIAERDRRVLARACPEADTYVVPNGVDLERYRPPAKEPGPHELVFVGNMSVLHNIDAVQYLVREILPGVRARAPEAHLTVVGADPVPDILALNEHPAVTVTGFVPDLNRALNRAAVFVAPLRFAAGVQTKVIEAMAAGRPVVTTRVVNEGVGAVPDRDLLVADDPAVLIGQIAALCGDPERRRRLGAAARRFVAEHHTWRVLTDRMRAVETALQ